MIEEIHDDIEKVDGEHLKSILKKILILASLPHEDVINRYTEKENNKIK